ncbi:hypothetical protein AAFF_G00359000 [Aldrovandia affinis]|uniref:Uncharacterized protein n=1 Tax=Aldrovandia affinis TaxID=143900 RepID=A0AAD7SI61_9TELE|nr:hypothetical protein AAFF_G00359000 [Aldrovandia affinis]
MSFALLWTQQENSFRIPGSGVPADLREPSASRAAPRTPLLPGPPRQRQVVCSHFIPSHQISILPFEPAIFPICGINAYPSRRAFAASPPRVPQEGNGNGHRGRQQRSTHGYPEGHGSHRSRRNQSHNTICGVEGLFSLFGSAQLGRQRWAPARGHQDDTRVRRAGFGQSETDGES